jgi:hypothetical protein
MRRIYALSISLLLISTISFSQEQLEKRVERPFSLGIELSGPIISALDTSSLNYEISLSYRLNHKYFIVIEPGFTSFSYTQYNYDYLSSGGYLRAGVDINLMKPKAEPGNHYAGIGLRYGISLFNQETPLGSYSNYWGDYNFAIEREFVHAHFLEASGGVKAELFRNILIGWTFRARVLIYQSAGKENKPVSIPGLGETNGGIQPGFSYQLIWILPFKKGV